MNDRDLLDRLKCYEFAPKKGKDNTKEARVAHYKAAFARAKKRGEFAEVLNAIKDRIRS